MPHIGLKLVIVALVVGVAITPAIAQTLADDEVSAGTAFQLAANHDGLNTTEYRLFRNGTINQTKPVSALSGGIIVFDQPGLSVGTYSYRVDAVGTGGTTVSDLLSVFVVGPAPVGPPAAPSGLRVLR